MKRQRVAVFGSTGSIGRSALDCLARLRERFQVVALAANRSVDLLCEQAVEFHPRWVLLSDPCSAEEARRRLGNRLQVGVGQEALSKVVGSGRVDILIMAMSGTAGLDSVMAALRNGKRVALATKEILVAYGIPVLRAARRWNAELLPIDSELAALHQCLAHRPVRTVRRVLLTASGGPFWSKSAGANAKIADVLRHPTWSMGPKITVDSATLANKGLEVIETVRLFGFAADQVETIIHPQSTVHALVEFADGSVIAQLSVPDMRLAIQYCLTYPDRLPSPVQFLSLPAVGRLEFYATDLRRFPCLELAYKALRSGPAGPCAFNAANEVAVRAFLDGRIEFGAIPHIIGSVLSRLSRSEQNCSRATISRLKQVEAEATRYASRLVERN